MLCPCVDIDGGGVELPSAPAVGGIPVLGVWVAFCAKAATDAVSNMDVIDTIDVFLVNMGGSLKDVLKQRALSTAAVSTPSAGGRGSGSAISGESCRT
jgi:hypothetical protein